MNKAPEAKPSTLAITVEFVSYVIIAMSIIIVTQLFTKTFFPSSSLGIIVYAFSMGLCYIIAKYVLIAKDTRGNTRIKRTWLALQSMIK